MTQQHNPEQTDQELSQEQLKEAAGGISMNIPDIRGGKSANALDKSTPKRHQDPMIAITNQGPQNLDLTSGRPDTLDVSSGGCGGEDKYTPEPFS